MLPKFRIGDEVEVVSFINTRHLGTQGVVIGQNGDIVTIKVTVSTDSCWPVGCVEHWKPFNLAPKLPPHRQVLKERSRE